MDKIRHGPALRDISDPENLQSFRKKADKNKIQKNKKAGVFPVTRQITLAVNTGR